MASSFKRPASRFHDDNNNGGAGNHLQSPPLSLAHSASPSSSLHHPYSSSSTSASSSTCTATPGLDSIAAILPRSRFFQPTSHSSFETTHLLQFNLTTNKSTIPTSQSRVGPIVKQQFDCSHCHSNPDQKQNQTSRLSQHKLAKRSAHVNPNQRNKQMSNYLDDPKFAGRVMLTALFIVSLLTEISLAANPNRRLTVDPAQLARISNSLSVARSPFEPVTLAASFLDGSSINPAPEFDSKRLTTRAATGEGEEPDASRTEGETTTQGPVSSSSTTPGSITTTPETAAPQEETATNAPAAGTTSETNDNTETDTTPTTSEVPVTTTTSSPTTPTTTTAPISTTTPLATESKVELADPTTTPSSISPAQPSEPTTTTPEMPTTTATPPSESNTDAAGETPSEQPINETATETTAANQQQNSSGASSTTVAAEIGNFSATTPASSRDEEKAPATTASPTINEASSEKSAETGETTSEQPAPTTTTSQPPEVSSVANESAEQQPSSSSSPVRPEPERASTEAQPVAEPAATESPTQPLVSDSPSASSTESPASQEQPVTKAAEEIPPSTEQPVQPPASQPDSPQPTTTTSSPETITTAPEESSSRQPESPVSTTTSTTSTTTIKPTESESESSAGSKPKDEGPETSHKPPSSEPQPERGESDSSKPSSSGSCNHLPNYEPDEIQKVFREETTYKNGTIKGKFTYLNFDQRYRLVHYTRLPYGPIKIDFVDDLGRPDQKNTESSNRTPNRTTDDTPDSVLQLRNILPNSLFGFPFLNPSYKPQVPSDQRSPDGNANSRDNVASNPFYYSTDSIATPNLPSGSHPLAYKPGRRRFDGDIHYASVPNSANFGDPSLQMQYNLASQAAAHETFLPRHQMHSSVPFAHNQPLNTFASHSITLNSNNNHQYQFHESPLIPMNQAAFIPSLAGQFQPNPIQEFAKPPVFEYHTTGQLHRTYTSPLGPFMFLSHNENTNAGSQSQVDTMPHIKLHRVKTSRNMGAGSGVKSAQIRQSRPNDSGQASPQSPVQNFRVQRQRSGKQSSELRAPVNSRPIVYHVRTNRMHDSINGNPGARGKAHEFSVAHDHEN